MRVYAESNFVLEVALDQEDAEPCKELLALATAKTIELVIPAYAIVEPAHTVQGRIKKWKGLFAEVDRELGQLKRTQALTTDAAALSALAAKAMSIAGAGYESARSRLLSAARIVPLDLEVFNESNRVRQQFALELPDAIILASVLIDLRSRNAESVFINKNTNDFDDPDIISELKSQQCKFFGRFASGLAYVKAQSAAT